MPLKSTAYNFTTVLKKPKPHSSNPTFLVYNMNHNSQSKTKDKHVGLLYMKGYNIKTSLLQESFGGTFHSEVHLQYVLMALTLPLPQHIVS